MKLRIGSVPYLNAKPLVDFFHSSECDADVEVIYEVPSKLAKMIRRNEIDVCNCSIFEGMRQPGLAIIPGISISSDGPVKSVRLFCHEPIQDLKSVALDTSSLSSAALTRILLAELYNCSPNFSNAAPDLDAMLLRSDAGLIIGDLKLFDLHGNTTVYDLGELWKTLTGLPFVYAAWQAPIEKITPEMIQLLRMSRDWGTVQLDVLAAKWASIMSLPTSQCTDYFINAINYDLTEKQILGMRSFEVKLFQHGLICANVHVPVAN